MGPTPSPAAICYPRDIMKWVHRQAITKEDHHFAAFSAPRIMVPFVSPDYEYQASKISVSELQNSLFRPSKFAFQVSKIRFSDLQNSFFRSSKFALQGLKNSRFKASKFALQGLTDEPKKSIESQGRELKYCLK